jgi:hypothetical protein
MATANYDQTYQGAIEPKNFSTSFAMTLHQLERAKTSKAAFKDLGVKVIKNAQTKHKRVWWRQLWNGPAAGCLGKIDIVVGTNTKVTVKAPDSGTGYYVPANGFRINIGDVINFFDTMSNTARNGGAGFRVTNVSTTTTALDTVTFEEDVHTSGALTVVNDDYMFFDNALTGVAGTVAAATYGEPLGIPVACDDSTTHLTLTTASLPWFKSVRNHNNGTSRPITRALMHKIVNQVRYGLSKKSPDMIVCNLAHQDSIAELLWGIYQEPRKNKVEGGYGDVSWRWPGSKPVDIFFDDMCVPGTIWFLNSEYLRMQALYKTRFVDDENGLPAMRRAGYQIFEGAVTTSYNGPFAVNRNVLGRLEDVEFEDLAI